MTEKHKIIIELYDYGLSPTQIVEKANCSIGTIYNVLKRNNIPTRNGSKGVTKDEIEKIKKMNSENKSFYEIMNVMGIHYEKLKLTFEKLGINNVSSAKRQNPNLKEDYFKKIDSEEKAYWIGWLITDGCVTEKDHSISISLQEQDSYILTKFSEDLGLEDKVKIFNKKYKRFYFCCKEIANDLKQYGIIQNKTFTVSIPIIPEHLYPSLLRGCIDGDGSILLYNTRGKYEAELQFTGNYECVKRFNEIVSALTGIKPKNIIENRSIYRVRWCNKDEIIKICEVIYRNSDGRRLERKYNKFLKIKEVNNSL